MNRHLILLTLLLPALLLFSCRKEYSPEEQVYISKILVARSDKDMFMESSLASPFNYKKKIKFEKLKYYDVNPDFVFKSKLYEFEVKDTLTIFGTKGEKRTAVRFGYVKFQYNNKPYHVNVYQSQSPSGEEYYSIWFTDKTTGKETYGVGRYLDIEYESEKNYTYTIDFNLAYNPYCAYSPEYSCAIPTKEDHIDLAVEAGEKKFH